MAHQINGIVCLDFSRYFPTFCGTFSRWIFLIVVSFGKNDTKINTFVDQCRLDS